VQKLILYSRKKCPLCDKAKDILLEIQNEHPFELEEVDIDESDALTEKYGLMIPVVEIEEEVVQYGQIDRTVIMKRLQQKTSAL
jgi:glutaredoxin